MDYLLYWCSAWIFTQHKHYKVYICDCQTGRNRRKKNLSCSVTSHHVFMTQFDIMLPFYAHVANFLVYIHLQSKHEVTVKQTLLSDKAAFWGFMLTKEAQTERISWYVSMRNVYSNLENRVCHMWCNFSFHPSNPHIYEAVTWNCLIFLTEKWLKQSNKSEDCCSWVIWLAVSL